MSKLSLDLETYSECNLKACGVYRYAEHPSTEVLCAAYAFDDLPVKLWVPAPRIPEEIYTFAAERGIAREQILAQLAVPADLRQHIEGGGEVRAHNYQFERTVLNGVAGKKIGFPRLTIDNGCCTAAKMRAHGLPGALGDAAAALGTKPKNAFGHNVMLQLCKPRNGEIKRYTLETEPEKYAALFAYCIDDVEAERGIDEAVPDLTDAQMKVWRLDQRINDRGIGVDLKAIADIEFLIDQYKEMLEKLCLAWTGFRPSQNEKIVEWVRGNGYPQIVCMDADAVRFAVKDKACPEHIKQVLRLYSTYGMKAVSKYKSMTTAACADGRLRGMFLYYGAGTGRWSSMIVQLQNLFRPVIKDANLAIEMFKDRDLEWIKLLYTVDPMKVFASCIRGMLIPAEGHEIQAIDLAGIESRLTAWVFNEAWKIKAFRAKDDKTGPDTYSLTYANLFRIPVSEVTDFQRQIGKVLELSMGFEGGVGAFVQMAANYNVDLDKLADAAYPNIPESVLEAAYSTWEWASKTGNTRGLEQKVFVVCESLKVLWRVNHPAHAGRPDSEGRMAGGGWSDLKEAAHSAVRNPGTVYTIPSKLIRFKVEEFKGRQWLYMRLPSGRRIAYYKPELREGRPRYGKPSWVLSYLGVDTDTRRWMRVDTYGGRLTQNFAEGIAYDLLCNGLFKLEDTGYPIIGSVHDEGIAEPKIGHGSLEEARAEFLDAPSWSAGLPLNAEGFRASRYRK